MSGSRRPTTSSHHHHGGHSHHRRSRSPRYSDEDEHQSSSSDYKSLYKECKSDLKRKRREFKDLEEDLRKEKDTSKKAKQDTQDLWKIYYTLQQELQQSYERNAKLQSEKATVDADLAAKRKEEEEKKAEGSDNPDKMREALFAMQKQKLEMQQKFNDIVLENKKLKEKELTYEPRLRELEIVKGQVGKAHEDLATMSKTMASVREQLVKVSFTAEEVNKYKRWNALLIREAEQKGVKLCRLEADVVETSKNSDALTTLELVRPKIAALLAEVKQLKLDVASWSGAAVKDTIAKTNTLLREALEKYQFFATKMNLIDLSGLKRLRLELIKLAGTFVDDKDLVQLIQSLCALIDRKIIPIEASASQPMMDDELHCPVDPQDSAVTARVHPTTAVNVEPILDEKPFTDHVLIASSYS